MDETASHTKPSSSTRSPQGERVLFGTRLRGLLEERDLNQTEFSARVGVDRTELNRTINNKRQPKPDEVIWFAEALNLTVEELLDQVELPASLRKTKDELQKMAERVLGAESAQEQAEERARLAEEALAEEKGVLTKERDEFERRLKEERWKFADERARHQEREEGLQQASLAIETQLQQSKEQVTAKERMLRGTRAENSVLKAQLAEAHRTIASERTSKVTGTLIAGLAGTLLGSALGGGDDGDNGFDDDE